MTCFLCLQCGVQFAASDAPPQHCPICEDERQYVRWEGQAWITPEELAATHRLVMKDDAGVLAFGIEPRFAIGQRALLVADAGRQRAVGLRPAGQRRGGGRDQPAWRPLGHRHLAPATTTRRWSSGARPLAACRSISTPTTGSGSCGRDKAIVFWEGETHAHQPVADADPLRRPLRWRHGAALEARRRQRRAADRRHPAGRADPQHVSFMYSYPNYIPLNATAVRRIAAVLESFEFDHIHGAWWGQNVIGGAKAAFAASVARYLAAIA